MPAPTAPAVCGPTAGPSITESSVLLQTIRLLCNKGKDSIANSIQKSSRRTYSTGVRRWIQFVQVFGTDTFMRKVPREFLQYQDEAGAFHHFHGFFGMVTGPAQADHAWFCLQIPLRR